MASATATTDTTLLPIYREAMEQFFKSKFGNSIDLSALASASVNPQKSHHLGGSLGRLLQSDGTLPGLPSVWVADTSAYNGMIVGYTTCAAAVAGVCAGMQA